MATAADEPDNIKAFNYIVLSVLTRLYAEFPQPTEIRGLRFVIETVLDKGANAVETKYAYLFSHTMRWLKQEGFITFQDQQRSDEFRDVALTLRGLTILGFVPKSLFGPKETIFQRAKRVVGKGIDDAASGTIKTIVGEALKLMAQLPRGTSDIAL